MNVVALAGGVGAAKFLWGLQSVLAPEDLTVVVNTGDDFEWMGLHVSPDLDTVSYTLAGIADAQHGWGIGGDTFRCLGRLRQMGEEDWFQIGDLDLATHLFRSRRLERGQPLAEVTGCICKSLGIRATILPMTESQVRTLVSTPEGVLEFQEYFVRRGTRSVVTGLAFQGIEQAAPAPGVLQAFESPTAIVVCPSNPLISIGPILAIPGLRDSLRRTAAVKLAISPLIGSRSIKGPTAKMMAELGHEVSPVGVARMYQGVCSMFIIDRSDGAYRAAIEDLGLEVRFGDLLMDSAEARQRLAKQVMELIR